MLLLWNVFVPCVARFHQDQGFIDPDLLSSLSYRWQLFEKACNQHRSFQPRKQYFILIYALFLVYNPTARDEKK